MNNSSKIDHGTSTSSEPKREVYEQRLYDATGAGPDEPPEGDGWMAVGCYGDVVWEARTWVHYGVVVWVRGGAR